MGPTQQTVVNYNRSASCPSNSVSTTSKTCQNEAEENENGEWGTVRKFKLNTELIEKETLKETFTCLERLSKLAQPDTLLKFRKCWIEGLSEDKLRTLSEFNYKIEEKDEVEFCSLIEATPTVPLHEFLEERKGKVLFNCQITSLISQLLTAVKFFGENDLELLLTDFNLEGVRLVQDKLVKDLQPKVKWDCFQSLIRLNTPEVFKQETDKDKNEGKDTLKNSCRLISEFYSTLLLKTRENLDKEEKDNLLESLFPLEWKIIEELRNFQGSSSSLAKILTDLSKIGSECKEVVLNVTEPCKDFTGREKELLEVEDYLTSEKENKLLVISGPFGIGKSEFVRQFVKRVLEPEKKESFELVEASKEHLKFNVICLNGSTIDALTTSLLNCAAHSKLQVPGRDYLDNPIPLKDIFQSILQVFSGKNVLIVLENLGVPTEELVDLIAAFDVTAKSEITKQFLIMVLEHPWNNVDFLEKSLTIQLSPLDSSETVKYLQLNGKLDLKYELECLADASEGIPANLQLATKLIQSKSLEEFKVLLGSANELIKAYDKLEQETFLRKLLPTHLASLQYFYKTLSADDKVIADRLLNFLQHFQGEIGITLGMLTELIKGLPGLENAEEDKIKSLISSLTRLSLIYFKNGNVHVTNCTQECLKAALTILNPSDDNLAVELLTVIRTKLCSFEGNEQGQDTSPQISEILQHATSIWTSLTRKSGGLVASSFAKQFEGLPEQIAKVGKVSGKLEQVIGFVKLAADTLSQALGNPFDIQVLKLKYFLGVESLLPKSKINEAFIIFKTCQEQSRIEPREFLMLKLKSLIEQGKIHILRQEYDKAMSCFQHVQIFAVQKIPTIELDSEPTLLHARMLNGYAFLLQNNYVEAKKILLQVIPLLERYAGPEIRQVRMLLLQGKFYLACLLRKSGDLVNALMMQTKVLEEREARFGARHPDTWSSKQEMALLYSSYDNHEKALALLRELLETQEEILGAPSNRQSLSTMNAIAEIELKLGNFDDALELYEAIDLIEQEVLTEQDEMRISTQLNQAQVLMSLGQYKEATDIFDLVYALKITTEDKEKAGNIALCDDILRRKEKAGRSMEILGNYWLSLTPENVDDPSELAALAKKHEVAMELSENQDNHGALRFLREVLEDSTNLEETNRFLLNVKADLARVLGLVGKFNESFSVYKEIIPLLDATFGETDELTMLCKDTMGQVFLFSGNQFLKRQMSNLKWFLL